MAVVLADGFAPEVPLTHARIGWATIVTESSITASSAASEFPATAPVNPLTWDRWLPEALPATWQVDAGVAADVDYLGIAAHTLADGLLNVTVQRSGDALAWTDVVTHEPVDNGPILFLFAPVAARYWRLLIDGGSPQHVGVIQLGQVLAMPRPIYGGLSPLALSRATTIQPQRSEQGQFLGRSVIRGGLRGELSWRHLSAAWYRTTFDPFVASALVRPFFLAWRPATFPEDVGYVWTGADIVPSNMGVRGLMQVSLPVEGLGVEPQSPFGFDLDESHVATANDEVDLTAWDLARFTAVVSWTATGSEAEGTRVIEWNDGTFNNQINISRVGGNVALNVVSGGLFQASMVLGAWTAGDHVAAIRVADDDFAGTLNGAAAANDGSGIMPALTTMLVAHAPGPTLPLGGGTVRVRLSQGVLNNTHLLSYSGGA